MKEILGVILVPLVGLVFIFWGANALNHSQCKNNVLEMGREYRYDFINGCRIQLEDDSYIYWKMYREVNN